MKSTNLNRPPDAVDFMWQWNDARKLKKEELKARLIAQEQARENASASSCISGLDRCQLNPQAAT
jgi:hypothetical protein